MTIPRKAYLSGDATHGEYYGQFVTEHVKQFVCRHISKSALLGSKDEHFNDIPLGKWETIPLSASVTELLFEAGDTLSLAGAVCIHKQAASEILAEIKQEK